MNDDSVQFWRDPMLRLLQLLICLTILGAPFPAHAAWVAANDGRTLYNVNADEMPRARKAIMAGCQRHKTSAYECKLTEGRGGCAAFARVGERGEGFLGIARTEDSATVDALEGCRRVHPEGCRVSFTFCDVVG